MHPVTVVRRVMLVGVLCLATGITSADRSPSTTPAPSPGANAVVVLVNASSPVDDLFVGQFCGGVLVAPDLVLTAAHCWRDDRRDGVDVVVGADNICKTASITGERRHVTSVLRHTPAQNGAVVDAALLVLNSPVTAQPIQLPHPGDPDPTTGVALGWGRNGVYGAMPCTRQEVPLTFVTTSRCEKSQVNLGITPATGWELCAVPDPTAKRNTCTGDSGSPVLTKHPPATMVGIVTWGPTCQRNDVGVYVRAAALANWIAEESGSHPARMPPHVTERRPTPQSTPLHR